jgi:acetyltransferase
MLARRALYSRLVLAKRCASTLSQNTYHILITNKSQQCTFPLTRNYGTTAQHEKGVDLSQVESTLTKKYTEQHPLDYIFRPTAIAVVGASEKEEKVGRAVLWNLMSSPIKVFPINRSQKKVMGMTAYPSLEDAVEHSKKKKTVIDLAVICVPPSEALNAIKDCVEVGIKGAILINGVKEEQEKEILRIANTNGLRILGPNSLGVTIGIVKEGDYNPSRFTSKSMNATHASMSAQMEGRVACIVQNKEMGQTLIDWSLKKHVGFSVFVGLGPKIMDVGWGDLIEYFGRDANTDAIVLYMNSIGDVEHAKKFVSAARTVSLKKPIIVVKSGRTQSQDSLPTSTVGSDQVFNVVFEQSGVLRVNTLFELAYMSQILARQPRPLGNNLAIITNAPSTAMACVDTLAKGAGQVAQLSSSTIEALKREGATVGEDGLIDLHSNASPERYIRAIDIVSKDPNNDALLVILTPQFNTEPTRTATLITHRYKIAQQKQASSVARKPIFACFMGGTEVETSISILTQAGIPAFGYPDLAANMFNFAVQYSQNLHNLYYAPRSLIDQQNQVYEQDIDSLRATSNKARELVRKYVEQGRHRLTEQESKYLISLYGISSTVDRLIIVSTEQEAVEAARKIGYPVALKLHSDLFKHKIDVGGVKLHILEDEQLQRAFRDMKESVTKIEPNLEFKCTVQPMVMARDEDVSYELTMHSFLDPNFGHIIAFGTGGNLRPIYDDQTIGIPPITSQQASRMVRSTNIYRALKGYRKKPPVNVVGLERLLVRFSQMVADLAPFIGSITLNPLLASSNKIRGFDTDIVVVDARVELSQNKTPLLIRPYPSDYVSEHKLKGDAGSLKIRPVRYEDHVNLLGFFVGLNQDQVKKMSDEETALSRLNAVVDMIEKQKTQDQMPPEPLQLNSMDDYWTKKIYNDLISMCIGDYDKEMALIAETRTEPKRIVALARYTVTSNGTAEISLLVGNEYQQHGVGVALVKQLIEIARLEGKKRLVARVSLKNPGMIRLCEKLGFNMDERPDGIICTLNL